MEFLHHREIVSQICIINVPHCAHYFHIMFQNLITNCMEKLLQLLVLVMDALNICDHRVPSHFHGPVGTSTPLSVDFGHGHV